MSKLSAQPPIKSILNGFDVLILLPVAIAGRFWGGGAQSSLEGSVLIFYTRFDLAASADKVAEKRAASIPFYPMEN